MSGSLFIYNAQIRVDHGGKNFPREDTAVGMVETSSFASRDETPSHALIAYAIVEVC